MKLDKKGKIRKKQEKKKNRQTNTNTIITQAYL